MGDAETPAPRVTVRAGLDVFNDVKDYLVIVRNNKNEVSVKTSSNSWAIGEMESLLIEIEVRRRRAAEDEE